MPAATTAATLEPFVRVGFACESLKVTTRIMHIVAWLLTQRAVETGELPGREGRRPERRLGHAGGQRSGSGGETCLLRRSA